jgi:hypothetical protein
MSYPAKYPPAVTPANWNAMVDRVNGFTPTGNFVAPYTYIICSDGEYYYAIHAFQTVYGGPSDVGDVDGTDANAVIDAVTTHLSTGDTIKCVGTISLSETLTLDMTTHTYDFYFDTLLISDDFNGLVIVGNNNNKPVNVIGTSVLYPSGYTSSATTLKNVSGLTLGINRIYPVSGIGAAGSICVHLLGENAGCFYNTIYLNIIGATETGVLLESTGDNGFVNSNAIYNAHSNYSNYGFKTLNSGINVSGNKFYNCVFEPISVTGSVCAYTITDTNNDFFGCATIDMESSYVDVDVSADGTAKFFGGQLANHNFNNAGILDFVCVDGVTPVESVKIMNYNSDAWENTGTVAYFASAINLHGTNLGGSAVYAYTSLNMLFQNDGWTQEAFPFNKLLTINFGIEIHDGITTGTERYVQLKASDSIGALDALGCGIYIDGDKLYGEAFGTARQITTEYYTLTVKVDVKVTILWHVGTDTVTFYVNGIKLGSLTGTAVYSNGILYPKFFISGNNGSNNEYTSMTVGNIEISRGS